MKTLKHALSTAQNKTQERIIRIAFVNGYLLSAFEASIIEGFLASDDSFEDGRNLSPAAIAKLTDDELWKTAKTFVIDDRTRELDTPTAALNMRALRILQKLVTETKAQISETKSKPEPQHILELFVQNLLSHVENSDETRLQLSIYREQTGPEQVNPVSTTDDTHLATTYALSVAKTLKGSAN